MKIMTFNIQHAYNYTLEKVDYEMLSSEIKKIDPTVLGINEIYGETDESVYGNQVQKIAKLAGYDYYFFAKAFNHEHGPYGNAIFSKIPILNVETVIIEPPKERLNPTGYYETRCLLVAKLANGMKVIVTHFGLNKDEVENEIEVVMSNLDNTNCIFMGDLNTLPNDELLNPIKHVMNDVSIGFCDEALTFPSFKPKIKIDYIFTSPDICVKDSYVLEKVISDHFAHIAIIDKKYE